MQRERRKPVDPVVFWTSLGLIGAFTVLGYLAPRTVGEVATAGLNRLLAVFGWGYILAAAGFVIFALLLAFSRYGRIPLSRDGEEPEFSTVSWIAMMFAGGMGIGLMFYGVAEPIAHLANPAPGTAQAGTVEAGRVAMRYTFFHWTIHPWAIYGVVGIALAYSTYRKGRGNLMSAPFESLLGERVHGAWGKPLNIYAVVATKFGSATSLGLGALQVTAGLGIVFGLPSGTGVALAIVFVLTIAVVISAVSGVARGIKLLSNTNMVLAAILALFVFFVGPTVFILGTFARSTGDLLYNFIPMTFRTSVFGGGADWLSNWTIFFWAWWVSWALHVGTFLARVSRGRTIREFIVGVVVAPTVVSMLWFSIFGATGLNLQLTGQADIVATYRQQGLPATLFTALSEFPIFTITGTLVILLVSIFFVTGGDTGAFVLSMLSSYGQPEPRRVVTGVWGASTGAVAGVLLLVGGLDAIQTFVILTAAPFLLVMVGLCWALYTDLRKDPLRQQVPGPVLEQAPATARPPETSTGQPARSVEE